MNAADADQVSEAEKKQEDLRRLEISDLKFILGHPQGRRLLWRLMEKCRTFSSVWDPSAKIHYKAGQQDLGHFIMSEVAEADQEAFFKMMREQQRGEKK